MTWAGRSAGRAVASGPSCGFQDLQEHQPISQLPLAGRPHRCPPELLWAQGQLHDHLKEGHAGHRALTAAFPAAPSLPHWQPQAAGPHGLGDTSIGRARHLAIATCLVLSRLPPSANPHVSSFLNEL